jgi:hypothetical protein
MATAPVPAVIGMTREAAVAALVQSGLTEGTETSVVSAAPLNSVTRSIPSAGTQLAQGTRVDIDISVGLRRARWWENTSSFIFSVLGIITLLTLLTVLGVSSFTDKGPLQELGRLEIARGLITFLIAFTTVGIALILAISTVVLQDSPENDKRFDRGKQILTVLIGVLGTIVGFYFASEGKGTVQVTNPAITSTSLPPAVVGTKYADTPLSESGGTPPFKWSVKPALPPDLNLSDAGVLSGTPKGTGTDKTFTFTVVDSNANSASKGLDLTIQPGAAPTQVPPKTP